MHNACSRFDDRRTRRDHYAEVTAQIIAALEAGTPPWRQPWDSGKAGGPMRPQNATTGAHYRGINVLMLSMSPLALASGDPRWATYKQATDHGWQVRKGEHGTTAYFFKQLELADTGDEPDHDTEATTRRIPLLRAFCSMRARSTAFRPSRHRPMPRRPGAHPTPPRPSSPTVASPSGSAATEPITRL